METGELTEQEKPLLVFPSLSLLARFQRNRTSSMEVFFLPPHSSVFGFFTLLFFSPSFFSISLYSYIYFYSSRRDEKADWDDATPDKSRLSILEAQVFLWILHGSGAHRRSWTKTHPRHRSNGYGIVLLFALFSPFILRLFHSFLSPLHFPFFSPSVLRSRFRVFKW